MIERDTEIADAEIWFRAHGLPWFVDAEHERVHALLGRGRLTTITLLAAVPALALGITLGVLSGAPSSGFALFATLTGALALAWVARRLRAGPVLGWALRRIRGQLYLLVPLVTRALPLLLIFTVFFFINTEVWQVASSLPPGVLWLSVLMFAALAVLFLVARLPEEVDRVVAEVEREQDGAALRRACQGTPVEDACDYLLESLSPTQRESLGVPLTGLQRANLVLVLLVVQAGQVLLLAAAVFTFFTVFGMVAIRPEIIQSWVGELPRAFPWPGSPLSIELLQVAVFLSGFSGLYFTVYAVTDSSYREQFFTQITTELEHAIGVRAVYRVLTSGPAASS